MSDYTTTFEYCDDDALPAESTSASSLAPDQLYKLCPGSHKHTNGTYAPLGQPRCGDGTNYSFIVARPAKQPKQEKIIIELSGGGACWDLLTCKLMGSWLTFPQFWNGMVGTNCSDTGSFLCSKTVGGIDFSEYTTVFIPYCTQDVHLGDAPDASYDGTNIVRHVGAHNIYRTLSWIFENFPDPSNIFITGCSAGGTPLPVMYDLINSHYKDAIGEQTLTIDVVADSPVFVTPAYFLQNYFPNWNAGTLLKKIGFAFDEHKNDEAFPYELLEYALERSKETDTFGFVTHDNDQVSLTFYMAMSGNIFGRDRMLRSIDSGPDWVLKAAASDFDRRMTGDATSQWWSEMNNSMADVMDEHSNYDMFVMDGDGHCNFGLNVPLQYSGFEEWLTNTFSRPVAPFKPPINSSMTILIDPAESLPTTATNNMAAQQASVSFATTIVVLLSLRFLSYLA